MTCNTNVNEIIIVGIKDCINHHTQQRGGTCTTADEVLIKNIAVAYLFCITKDNIHISNTALNRATGASRDQFSQAHIKVKELPDNYYIEK